MSDPDWQQQGKNVDQTGDERTKLMFVPLFEQPKSSRQYALNPLSISKNIYDPWLLIECFAGIELNSSQMHRVMESSINF